ncbi:Phospholipid scramblase family protein [Termitomyces sp. T112]|nr:Phospholipid scramblase family protein [Termitomyces sp. T112]
MFSSFRRRHYSFNQRTYTLSRFPIKQTGVSRTRRRPPYKSSQNALEAIPHEEAASGEDSQLWHTSMRPPTSYPEDGLRYLLLENHTLVVERQIEMLNIFVGFEQSNRYTISNEVGKPVGYIAEEPKGFLGTMARQVFATHRPFKAVVMDARGSPILWIRRPFAWINSRMYVQRLKEFSSYTPDGEPVLDTFAEVQQVWHPWQRRYDLFLREGYRRILSTASEPQPEPETTIFTQFAKVDMGFLSWHFRLSDGRGDEVAYIDRAFRGFGREIFTDTGRYSVTFGPGPKEGSDIRPNVSRDLTLDERALTLALAVNIDFDYFSRKSGSSGLLPISY